MRYRDPKKESDLFSMIEHQQSVLKAVKGINKLNAVIDCHSASSSWPRGELFREDLESILGYDHRDPKVGGRPPFDAVLMLKVLVLQKYYGLSDEELATNKLRSRIRVRCEHLFGRMSQMVWIDYEPSACSGPGNTMDSVILFIKWIAMPSYAAKCRNGRKKRLVGPKTT